MYTRQELSTILGLSTKQVRTRLDHLARQTDLLQGQVGKGPNGRLEYSPAVVAMLRDLAPLAHEPGTDNGKAARELGARVQEQKLADGQGKAGKAGNPTRVDDLVDRLLAEKDATIRRLESEVSFLRERVEYLEPLALPPVREEDRRPWIVRRLRSLVSRR